MRTLYRLHLLSRRDGIIYYSINLYSFDIICLVKVVLQYTIPGSTRPGTWYAYVWYGMYIQFIQPVKLFF